MSKKLNLTVSGKSRRTKVVTKRNISVELGGMYKFSFKDQIFMILPNKATMMPSGCGEVDYGEANALQIRIMLMKAIDNIERFDKEAALAELKLALEQVDEIVELVK